MTTKEQNDFLTQTGPGTPMGNCFGAIGFRSCTATSWAARTAIRCGSSLLSERLLAFRDTEGRVGLIDEFCAHRGVSLWFGRNEECGFAAPITAGNTT